jgi:tetratricopeptide (TPR) repeat protein
MKSISLLDPRYMGGLQGAAGYRFEDLYVVSQLPEWVGDSELEAFQQERLSDVELFFQSGRRHRIQIKNHRLSIPELRDIIRDFSLQEQAAPDQVERYTIASPGMTRPGERIRQAVERLSRSEPYGGPEVTATRQDLGSMLDTHGLGEMADLVIAKVRFDTNMGWLRDEARVRDVFVGAVGRGHGISSDAALELYCRAANLIPAERGAVIPLSVFREAIDSKRLEAEATGLHQFDLITCAFLDRYRQSEGPSYFYDGAVPQWSDIVNERDICRDVMPRILHDLTTWQQQGTLLLPVLAEAGEGKSTLMLRLAAALARAGESVLVLRRDASLADSSEVRRVAEMTNRRVYVFIDNAPRVQNFCGFVDSLCDTTVPIAVVATSRLYEWPLLRSLDRSGVTVARASDGEEYVLQGLSNAELSTLFRRLAEEGLIRTLSDEELEDAVQYHAEATRRKLLVLVLELTRGKKASEVVRDEIEHLRTMGVEVYTAYRYICLMASVHSYVTLHMLRQLVDVDNVGLDIVARLPGVVDRVGDRILPRHERIAEIATDLFFEGEDEECGETLCNLMSLAFELRELAVIKPLARISRSVPRSQVRRITGHLFDEAYCAGESKFLLDMMQHLLSDRDNYGVFLDLLAVKTPVIWESLVFPTTPECVHLEISWDQLGKALNIPFALPDCPNGQRGKPVATGSVEEGVSWAEIFSLAATEGRKHARFFTAVAELMHVVLAATHEEAASDILFSYGEFLRRNLREEHAARVYQLVLDHNSDHAQAHAGLALSLYVTGDYQGALRHYRTSRALDRDAVFQIGFDDVFKEMLQRLGELEECLAYQRDSTLGSFRMGRRFDAALAELDRYSGVRDLRVPADSDNEAGADGRTPKRWVSRDYSDEAEREAIAALDRIVELVLAMSDEEKDHFGGLAFGSRFGELRDEAGSGRGPG